MVRAEIVQEAAESADSCTRIQQIERVEPRASGPVLHDAVHAWAGMYPHSTSLVSILAVIAMVLALNEATEAWHRIAIFFGVVGLAAGAAAGMSRRRLVAVVDVPRSGISIAVFKPASAISASPRQGHHGRTTAWFTLSEPEDGTRGLVCGTQHVWVHGDACSLLGLPGLGLQQYGIPE